MNPGGPFFANVIALLILQIPFIVAAVWLAPKMGARRWLWISLTAIPFLGLFAGYALIFRVAGAVLDKLNRVLDKLNLLLKNAKERY